MNYIGRAARLFDYRGMVVADAGRGAIRLKTAPTVIRQRVGIGFSTSVPSASRRGSGHRLDPAAGSGKEDQNAEVGVPLPKTLHRNRKNDYHCRQTGFLARLT